MHKNPKVRQVVQEELGDVDRVTLIDPLDYEPFANLMAKSYLILTDSGGIQEEAPALGKPVLVLRDTTERPEAVDAGTVRLVGTDKDAVYKAAYELLHDEAAYKTMSNSVNPYGDGKASERILQALRHEFLDKDMVKALAMATSAGLTLLFCIAGFIWIGYKLDTWMDTMPLCMVILGLIGAVTGFYMLYKQVK